MSNPLFDAISAQQTDQSAPFLYLMDETVWSYRDFFAKAAQLAHVLAEYGLQPGDRVAVQVDKSPHALALYVGCLQAGLIFLPLNSAYTGAELDYFIENSGAALFVCRAGDLHELEARIGPKDVRIVTLEPGHPKSLADASVAKATAFATIARDIDDIAALLYTSGTTGRAKGAMLSQGNLLSNARTLKSCWQFTRDDVLLHALPIYHTHGLFVAVNITLLAGGALIFLPKFDLDQVIAAMPKATAMMGVPTFYTRLLASAGFTRDLAAHMRLFISGSAPLLAETHIQFERRTGHRILERYGMTETNMTASNPYDGERRPGTVGFALPGVEVKITDPETAKPVADGEIGQIEVRGPNVFKGYWNMPEKTRAELREDGFFITGDLGQFDQDGYLHIVGRNKDLIISGGFNIYPKEIELLLDRQPGVLESAVIGVPHPDLGETVIGVLVPEKGATVDTAAIAKSIGTVLARFKQPRALVVVDELPRNAMGKVQKNILRKDHDGAFS